MFVPEPGRRYDMPVPFGPSLIPDVSAGQHGLTAGVSYLTTKDAVVPLLARWYEPADDPVVTVYYLKLMNLDWLHGRSYNVVGVHVSAVFRDEHEVIAAPFSLVTWENDANPIISGREFLGTPKLYGEIPDVPVGEPELGFSCSEYGCPILRADLRNLRERTMPELAELNRVGGTYLRLLWKYIPGPGGVPDADYPTVLHQQAEYERAWVGEGEAAFLGCTPAQAPMSSRVVARLAVLPVVERRPAVAATSALDGTAEEPDAPPRLTAVATH